MLTPTEKRTFKAMFVADVTSFGLLGLCIRMYLNHSFNTNSESYFALCPNAKAILLNLFGAMLVILLVLPFASVIPSAVDVNAVFTHCPRRFATLAHIYALGYITSLANLLYFLLFPCVILLNAFYAQLHNLQTFVPNDQLKFSLLYFVLFYDH